MSKVYKVAVFLLVVTGAFALFVAVEKITAPTVSAPASRIGDGPKPLRP